MERTLAVALKSHVDTVRSRLDPSALKRRLETAYVVWSGPTTSRGAPKRTGIGLRGRGLSAPLRKVRWPDYPALHQLVAIFWGHRQLIAGCTAAAVALAVLAHMIIAPNFSATAVVQFGMRDLMPQNSAEGQTAPAAMMDAAALVESETRLIESPALSRVVVDRLAREADVARLADDFPSMFGRFQRGAGPTPAELDGAASRLSGNLAVKNDPRTYLVSVTYKAPSAGEAARVANAVVAQYLHNARVQNLAGAHAGAERTLADLQVTYGPKHPQIIRAKSNLAMAKAQMDVADRAALMPEADLAGTGQVIPARANSIPTNTPFSKILVICAAIGLLLGLAIVQLLERQALRELVLRHLKY